MLQAVLLQNCLPFSPHPLQHDPCEQVLTVSWDGAEAEASLYSPFPSLLLSPRHIAVTPAMPSPSPSLALTYIVPYLCCKYNIKL